MNKKIIVSLIAIAAVAAVAGGATVAYFSDTETASGNTFAAGTLDLKVDGADGSIANPIANININGIGGIGIKPGETGNAKTWLLRNAGSLPGTLTYAVGSLTNTDGTPNDFETWTGSPLAPTQPGELGGKLKMAMWLDRAPYGDFGTGDYYLNPTGCTEGTLTTDPDVCQIVNYDSTHTTIVYFTANNFESKVWSDNSVAGVTDAGNFRVEYDFPNATDNSDNIAQGDGVAFGLEFGLKQ